MNIRTCILAFVAVGFCLFSTVFSAPIARKIYVVRNDGNDGSDNFLMGVIVGITNKNDEEIATDVFGVVPYLWDEFVKSEFSEGFAIEYVKIEELPVQGLFKLLTYYPELYSKALPYLLANTSPKEVAAKLPSNLLNTLTLDARGKIDPQDLAELENLYVESAAQ